jgi:hypothetical protein
METRSIDIELPPQYTYVQCMVNAKTSRALRSSSFHRKLDQQNASDSHKTQTETLNRTSVSSEDSLRVVRWTLVPDAAPVRDLVFLAPVVPGSVARRWRLLLVALAGVRRFSCPLLPKFTS